MKGIGFAEWLLRRVSSRENAAALVGDLLEMSRTRGALWFWRSIGSCVVRGGARSVIAFALAFGFSQFMANLWTHGVFGNRADLHSIYTTGMLFMAPLSSVPVFLLLRFGWRDAHARFAVLYASAAVVSLIFLPHPLLRFTLPAVAVTVCGWSLVKADRDWTPLQALAQLSSAVAISLGGLAIYLLTILTLWAVLWRWLQQPEVFHYVAVLLSQHPATDFINAAVCFTMLRASQGLQRKWATL
jgi:hypothetical protein